MDSNAGVFENLDIQISKARSESVAIRRRSEAYRKRYTEAVVLYDSLCEVVHMLLNQWIVVSRY